MRTITYANVASTVALVLAVGTGGAVAGSLITGADVKRDTLTGKHVKDKSLTERDIRSVPPPKLVTRTGPMMTPDCPGGECEGRQVIAGVAHCADGETPISGNVNWPNGYEKNGALTTSGAFPGGWAAGGWVELPAGPGAIPPLNVSVLCASW